MTPVNFCGINFDCLEHQQVFKEENKTRFVVTVNAEFIVKSSHNQKLLNIINTNHATFDGQIPYLFARLLNRQKHFNKISGSDLIYEACEYAQQHQKSLFLLGGNSESNAVAVENIKQRYGIRVEGYSPPYEDYPFTPENDRITLEKIQEFKPDFLFVGFGAIKQEYWINDHLNFLNQQQVTLAVGCGGTFDFVSGQATRAPRFVQKAGFEGVWRFITEPRLFRFKRLLESFHFFNVLYNHHIAIGRKQFL
ncbi:WecB/TagA/CpsF family glycosyltransferase [Thiothrix lacustris]|uniref:WecB/TagA/CpsF family glycosyltransferase n=1 Tax=Thiothrix lacustris TaxID=525917 RepID=A0ABY9MT42_9GAMM|nr:WecB/TagA/CpsF family glycosyltransferase [Thiothrix lacustris]WML91834.1 WecB/TagA/CpsF family glycosyltransferase [Thiothrix lacustris]